jgi:hypothetical protein
MYTGTVRHVLTVLGLPYNIIAGNYTDIQRRYLHNLLIQREDPALNGARAVCPWCLRRHAVYAADESKALVRISEHLAF